MIKGFTDINSELIKNVSNMFKKNYDFDSLLRQYPTLDYLLLWGILYSEIDYKGKLYEYLCQTSIEDKKFMIISDTHYGSKYENMSYIYDAFDFAVANNIHVILHGGDIIESNTTQNYKYEPIKQANDFIEKFPSDNNIITYAVLGNHDYSAINQYPKIKRIMSSREDIYIMGYKKAFFDWCGNVISLYHDIDKYKMKLPVAAECLSFRGHTHYYHVSNKDRIKCERIYMPAMCDDPIPYTAPQYDPNIRDMTPGFLIVENDYNNIIVNNYSFDNEKIIKKNEYVKVLKGFKKID